MEFVTVLLLLIAVGVFVVASLKRGLMLRMTSILVAVISLAATIVDDTLGVDGSYDFLLLMILNVALALMSCIWVLAPETDKK